MATISLRAAADGVQLRSLRKTANHEGHGLIGAGADREESLFHLHGQFARGQQDEGMRRGTASCRCLQKLHDGDQEAECFAGSSLRGSQHVAAFERRRNAAGLNRGGDFKFVSVEPRQKGGRKIELRELCCQNELISCWVPGAASLDWGLQTEPDLRRTHETCSHADLLSNYA